MKFFDEFLSTSSLNITLAMWFKLQQMVTPVILALRKLRQEDWWWVLHQPGLHSETLSERKEREREREITTDGNDSALI
jgi:hypothetical protein